jgi:hypothetical protein
MWEGGYFDLPAIQRELAWAGDIGLNCCRTFLPYLVWQADAEGLVDRMDRFLAACDAHGIRAMFVLLDDSGPRPPQFGPVEAPPEGRLGLWSPSIPPEVVANRWGWGGVKAYVTDLLWQFGQDQRILAWDLYNRPGDNGLGEHTQPLLAEVFEWARIAEPLQPLTVGLWTDQFPEIEETIRLGSDVQSFHHHGEAQSLRQRIAQLKAADRPMLCTDWLARPACDLRTHLPIFQQERVGCFLWQLVNGPTQTHLAPPGLAGPEPAGWYQDLLGHDGQPYDPAEVELLRDALGRNKAPG